MRFTTTAANRADLSTPQGGVSRGKGQDFERFFKVFKLTGCLPCAG